MQYETAVANRLGNRPSNQDRCAVLHRDQTALLLVADGMGGHERGELAAQGFVTTASHLFEKSALPIARPGDFLRDAVERAHHSIFNEGLQQAPPIRPRTTAVACLVQGLRACWAYVGDSRLYLIRDGHLLTRSRDHTYIEDLYRQGAIAEAELHDHPLRNFVTRSVGGRQEPPEVTISEVVSLRDKDVLLLCSDGLWSAFSDDGFLEMLKEDSLDKAVEAMAEAAEKLSYPASDNISAVALRVSASPEEMEAQDENTTEPAERNSEALATASEDDLDSAIQRIRDAIKEYEHEL